MCDGARVGIVPQLERLYIIIGFIIIFSSILGLYQYNLNIPKVSQVYVVFSRAPFIDEQLDSPSLSSILLPKK